MPTRTTSPTSSWCRPWSATTTACSDGDGLLCFNFRADRVREILAALLDPGFSGFPRQRKVKFAAAVGMTQYSAELDVLLQAIFPTQTLPNVLGEVVANARPHAAAHGGDGEVSARHLFPERRPGGALSGEEARIMVPSPKVATYDLQPEMSAPELTDKAVEAIRSGKYDLIVLNYANADMVGHTGSLPAAIKAVEAVDAGLGRLAEAVQAVGGAHARHRRSRQLRDDARSRDRRAAHRRTPPTRCRCCWWAAASAALADGRLADVAPHAARADGPAAAGRDDRASLLRRV